MNNKNNLLTIFSFSLLILLLASVANSSVINFKEIGSLKEKIVENLRKEFPIKPQYDTISICSQPEDLLEIDYIKLTPDPPRKGQQLLVEGSGSFKETIVQGSYLDVIIKYGIVKVYQNRFDLCELAPEVEENCPLEKGVHTVSKLADLPGNIFPGSYNIYVNVYTAEGQQIACLTGHVTFGF